MDTHLSNIKLIILGESPYNNSEQRSEIAFAYSEKWIEKNNLKFKIKQQIYPRDSLGNFLKELNRSFSNNPLDGFDLTLKAISRRGVLILNCYDDNKKDLERIKKDLENVDRNVPLLALGREAFKVAKKLGFLNIVDAPHPSPRSRKSFVGSGCLLELERLLNNNSNSLEYLFFGVQNESL